MEQMKHSYIVSRSISCYNHFGQLLEVPSENYYKYFSKNSE